MEEKAPNFTIVMHTSDFEISSKNPVQLKSFDNWTEMAEFIKDVYSESKKTSDLIMPDKEIKIVKN